MNNYPCFVLELHDDDIDYELELQNDSEYYELEYDESSSILPYYTGDYNVIPRVYEQSLETRQKSMSNDVTIQEIPKAEVSNIYGITITIG